MESDKWYKRRKPLLFAAATALVVGTVLVIFRPGAPGDRLGLWHCSWSWLIQPRWKWGAKASLQLAVMLIGGAPLLALGALFWGKDEGEKKR